MLIKRGIELATTEEAAPIVLVAKKGGPLRLCVDYDVLNVIQNLNAYRQLCMFK